MSGAADWRLVYDGGCRFCRWSLAWILRWDGARRLRPLALADPETATLLATLDPAEREASWHLVGPSGEVRSAGAAAAPLLRLLPGGRPPAAVFERFPRVVAAAYRAVAGRRSAFGRLVGERALARADALIGARRELPL